jgi:hypothetical protein
MNIIATRKLDKKEIGEIYNALVCLYQAIKNKQKRRTKYIQKLINEWQELL